MLCLEIATLERHRISCHLRKLPEYSSSHREPGVPSSGVTAPKTSRQPRSKSIALHESEGYSARASEAPVQTQLEEHA